MHLIFKGKVIAAKFCTWSQLLIISHWLMII